MGIRYFIIDNTPNVGRTNSFLCHVSDKKGFVHFLNADIKEKVIIPNAKKYKTKCFLVKLFVKSSSEVQSDNLNKTKHKKYSVDLKTLEFFPLFINTRSTQCIAVLKRTNYFVNGVHILGEAQRKFGRAMLSCIQNGYETEDFSKEISKSDYDQYFKDIEEEKRLELERFVNSMLKKKTKDAEEKQSEWEILGKGYSKDENTFYIDLRNRKTFECFIEKFDDFGRFYKACHGVLTGVDLLDCDFEGVDLSKYDLSTAIINSKVMKRIGLYDDRVVNGIKRYKKECQSTFSIDEKLVPDRIKYDLVKKYTNFEDEDRVLLYISDLHLNHKLLKQAENDFNYYEYQRYLSGIVDSLKKSVPNAFHKTIFFIGDVSLNFEVFKDFFRIYSENIFTKTYFILGNHELWDKKICKRSKNFNDIVQIYRRFLETVNITLIEGELLTPTIVKNSNFKEILNISEILEIDEKEPREAYRYNTTGVFGGLGFAGLNTTFNANAGIYRDAPITREFEIRQSELMSEAHKKLRKVLFDKKMIVITHMPPSDWCSDELCPNWIYVSGHTHKNHYVESKELTHYADNQIGYYNESIGFKFFPVSRRFNIFADYTDGIYEINRTEYSIFNYGIGSRSVFNRDFHKIFLLKKRGTYLFLLQKCSNGPLFILNGGSIKKAYNHDINYFYEKMDNYAASINLFLKQYSEYQKTISTFIKNIGGSGSIHGCIVDIDFFNHLYLNPLDGVVTAYTAESMVHKEVYKNFVSLLKYETPSLYANYKKLLEGNQSNALIPFQNNNEIDSWTDVVLDTSMYRVSRIIKSLQFTTDFNVIRLWNFSMAEGASEENGRMIVSGIINPMEKVEEKIPKQKVHKQKESKPAKKVLSAEEKIRIRDDKYKSKLYEQTNGKIDVVKYNGSREPSTYICKDCGYKWATRSDHLSRHNFKCPKCHNK